MKWLSSILLLCALLHCSTQQGDNKPNVIVIMADDIGLGDIGFYHRQRTGQAALVPTPNIDLLIASGIRFSDAHSPASLCAPTRFSMMTGNYSYRHKTHPWGVWQPAVSAGIEPDFTTIARIAKAGGYTTAFFGKWGLGGLWNGWPKEHSAFAKSEKGAPYFGFDYSFNLPQGIQNMPFAFYENGKWMPIAANSQLINISFEQTKYDEVERNKKREGVGDSNWDPALAGPMLVNKAVAYIKEQKNKEKPFYLYYCSQAVHVPHTPTSELGGEKIAGTTLGKHGDMIKELDAQVGMIMNALKESGMHENTLLVFTSDNGGLNKDKALVNAGHDSSNGFTGQKASIYEGGHRVPFIAVWPGKIKPNSVSDVTIVGHDMVATLAAIAEVPLDKSKVMDSANLLPIFTQHSDAKVHRYLIHQSQSEGGPYYALRSGDWKLILKGENRQRFDNLVAISLFNLRESNLETDAQNLVEDPAYENRITEMTQTFLDLRLNGGSTL